MFNYWKRRRNLRRNITEAEQEINTRLLKMKDATPDKVNLIGLALSDYRTKKEHSEMELEVLEAERLFKKADKYGVVGTPQQKIYDPKYTGVEPRRYFTPQNKAQYRMMIADAKRKLIGEWVGIISPLVTVIISLLALAISALALYLQYTRKTQ